MGLSPQQHKQIDDTLHSHNYTDYKWIDPQKIIVAQWVRMKCMFGCVEYGRSGACPPNTPSVTDCERFSKEYADAIILHFDGIMDKPETPPRLFRQNQRQTHQTGIVCVNNRLGSLSP